MMRRFIRIVEAAWGGYLDRNVSCWIDPSGRIIECGNRSHEEIIQQYLGDELDAPEEWQDEDPWMRDHLEAEERLEHATAYGWIRVCAAPMEFNTSSDSPTKEALRALRRMVKELPPYPNYLLPGSEVFTKGDALRSVGKMIVSAPN